MELIVGAKFIVKPNPTMSNSKQWTVIREQWTVRRRIAAGRTLRRCRLTTDHRPPTTAFTLVELLVVMTILAILASMVLFALASAQESARYDKTQATISKLNALIMAKYESYRTRRVPITIPAGANTGVAAQYRLDALRDLMRMEMPDRYSDITDDPVTYTDPSNPSTSPKISVPAVTRSYRKQITSTKTDQFENAECLYLLVTLGLGDPDIMEQFSPSEIGDTDGDGMLEFHDGWDRPINFLRWAPGFSSPLQPWNVNATDALGNATASPVYPTAHDPFDPLHIYKPASGEPFFNPAVPAANQVYPPLYPLIYSPGPDHISDIQDGGGSPAMQYSTTSPKNNPYATVSGGLLGAPTDLPSAFGPNDGVDNSIDNITNHE